MCLRLWASAPRSGTPRGAPGGLATLREMYDEWPFFRVTINLLEMVFAKGHPGIAALYDKLLVPGDLRLFGEQLRANYEETQRLLLLMLPDS